MQLVTITERTQSGEAIMYCSHPRVPTTHYQHLLEQIAGLLVSAKSMLYQRKYL